MPKFGEKSLKILATAHLDLQTVLLEAIKYVDLTITEGTRTKERQKELLDSGATKTLQSKHLMNPSHAVDVAPFPVDWSDATRFYYAAGVIMSIAERLYNEGKIQSKIRWGGDWNRNKVFKDENFRDLVHFEIDYN